MNHRTSSGVRPRAELETMHWCPVPTCKGGEIRTEKDTNPTTYTITIEDCDFCEGTGVVSKAKAAAYLAAAAHLARVGT